MTKEEKKAIEELRDLQRAFGFNGVKDTQEYDYLRDEEPENYITALAIETVLNLIQKQQEEIEMYKDIKRIAETQVTELADFISYKGKLEKKDKIIEQYEKECRQFKAFCRRVRRDEKHDVDLFNQGQEHKCNQFLNLISGEPHWSYAGKYFDDTDNQIKEYFEKKAEEN